MIIHMRIITIILLAILSTVCGYAYYDKHFKVPPPEPATSLEVIPPPYIIGQNDDYILTVPSESVTIYAIPAPVTVLNKMTGVHFTLPPIYASGAGYILNDSAKTTLLYSTGTSNVRTAHLIDLVNQKEISSFCHMGTPVFWKHYFVYADCTDSEERLKAKVIASENGEKMPIIYKIDLTTGEKSIVIKSDVLHNYGFDWTKPTTDSDAEFMIIETSVSKLSDWLHPETWKERKKVLKID